MAKYKAAAIRLQEHRTQISTLINERVPGAGDRRYLWDPDKGTIRYEKPPAPAVEPPKVDVQPKWAKKLADDLNAQEAALTYDLPPQPDREGERQYKDEACDLPGAKRLWP